MKLVQDLSGGYKDIVEMYWHLERFCDNDPSENVLFHGYAASRNKELKEQHKHYKRKIYINIESPCSFFSEDDNVEETHSYFDEVYSICPFTGDYLNKAYPNHKTKHIFIAPPVSYDSHMIKYKDTFPSTKIHDVFYVGYSHSQLYHDFLSLCKRKYNYIYCSLPGIPSNYITHLDVPSDKKYELLSQSKISIGVNVLWLKSFHIQNVLKYPNVIELNGALDHINELIAPQFKIRTIETALCKSLILMYKDPWNITDRWFKPGEEFLYWSSIEELEYIIDDVIHNYEKYWPIIEKAYEKAKKYYTVESLMKTILNKE